MKEYKQYFKIKNKDSSYHRIYKYKSVGPGMFVVSSVQDFICTPEEKSKISLWKGCSWEEILVEVSSETPKLSS